MIIIARSNQSDESPYKGLQGLNRAVQVGADMIELKVRTTADGVVVLSQGAHLNNAKTEPRVREASLKELRRHTAGSKQPIILFSDALKKLFGTVMIAIDISDRVSLEPLLASLKPYVKRKKDWTNLLFCSSNPLILRKLRRLIPEAQLALTHGRHTPLVFLAWANLNLSAVIIHRMAVNSLVIEAAHRLDYLVCAYTVDRPKTMSRLEALGVDAIITNHPEKF